MKPSSRIPLSLDFKVPRDPDDPRGAERQKEAQKLIDESEPLNEEEVAEKEQLLQEVTYQQYCWVDVKKDPYSCECTLSLVVFQPQMEV